MIKQLADQFYNKLYHMPPNAKDLEEFATKVLSDFIEGIKSNSSGVAWNGGFDEVIFTNKSVDGRKSLQQIKEDFLGQESSTCNSDVSEGAGVAGDRGEDSSLSSSYQFTESPQQ